MLSTNVAETSLTVPGVRYVVDTGVARISRYSKRLKVQRLPIEPISQASANQRAGRCGRVAPGVCIRLYDEDEFAERPEFTEPEILRTNLASVILQMTNIGLGDVANFPFLEPPDRASIRDGYLLLEELAAIERDEQHLTTIGRRLARLPIDPRLGRMVLESERHGCAREVLVIASGLSIQDPRSDPRSSARRPTSSTTASGSTVRTCCRWWRCGTTCAPSSASCPATSSAGCADPSSSTTCGCASGWTCTASCGEWPANSRSARTTRTAIPTSSTGRCSPGLLSHVGMRDQLSQATAPRNTNNATNARPGKPAAKDRREFIGARQARFVIAPGSVLTRRPPDWVMAAELVETNQIYARRVAAIKPQWAEQVGAHLVKRSYGEARWDEKGGRAVTTETVTLYGLPLANDRVIGLDRIDPDGARAWFITKALVENAAAPQWAQRHPFLDHNATFLLGVRRMADRVRRIEIVDDEMLFDFYDQRVGSEVTSTQHFDRWWKDARRTDPTRFDLTDAFVADTLHLDGFPDVWRQPTRGGDIELPLTYRYAPGEPLDGVTVHVPLSALNQITDDGFDWNVSGHHQEIASTLIRSLPKEIRRSLIPLNDTMAATLARLSERGRRPGDRSGERARGDPVGGVRHAGQAARLRHHASCPITSACTSSCPTRTARSMPSAPISPPSRPNSPVRSVRRSPAPHRSRNGGGSSTGTSAICRRSWRRPTTGSACGRTRRCSTSATACRCAWSPPRSCNGG